MRKSFLICIIFLAWMVMAGTSLAQQLSGTVSIDEVELAYIFNGTRGGGTLNFQGNTYSFKIGGLGVGGIGVSRITASGEVYNLQNIADFPGAYAEAGMGLSVADQGQGHLWLQNQNGVQLHLITSQQGLGLTSGADGVVIAMDQ
jgi:hypothetical protein